MRSLYAPSAACTSSMWSPPNFSRYAPASTSATIASATTAAAGTTVESVRSRIACAGSLVSVSTDRSGCVIVEIGFIAAWTTSGSPLVMPPSKPPPQAARPVGLPEPAAILGPEDLVVCLGPGPARDVPRLAERDALDRLDRADRLCKPPIELLAPGDVRSDARHQAEGAHLEFAAERLVLLPQPIDLLDHRLGGI